MNRVIFFVLILMSFGVNALSISCDNGPKIDRNQLSDAVKNWHVSREQTEEDGIWLVFDGEIQTKISGLVIAEALANITDGLSTEYSFNLAVHEAGDVSFTSFAARESNYKNISIILRYSEEGACPSKMAFYQGQVTAL
ncbi:hypothetical protein [Microbulbifer hydrolyticus]|uniref:Uncharacterized protein n=1 Tax=Microbulbifer hydrolyticus TaxID=48074 RepID=A0A6P1TA81_9GAMM|nr:hypothetical protein [Microbulbifer hydrolyticus]MBB5213297.1 hypothetical protein [Microbulbifer hydrolyticus]QHQ38681.1 hypothetical protein GTQ55_06545 [Microbulbifer hydrolyticus]